MSPKQALYTTTRSPCFFEPTRCAWHCSNASVAPSYFLGVRRKLYKQFAAFQHKTELEEISRWINGGLEDIFAHPKMQSASLLYCQWVGMCFQDRMHQAVLSITEIDRHAGDLSVALYDEHPTQYPFLPLLPSSLANERVNNRLALWVIYRPSRAFRCFYSVAGRITHDSSILVSQMGVWIRNRCHVPHV